MRRLPRSLRFGVAALIVLLAAGVVSWQERGSYAAGAALPATTLAHELFARLKDEGLGGEGTQALFKVIQAMAGDQA